MILLDINTLRHLVQLSQQFGRDGESVTASQSENLARVAEAGAHDDGVVPVLLVIVVNLSDGQHSGVLLSFVRLVVFSLRMKIFANWYNLVFGFLTL